MDQLKNMKESLMCAVENQINGNLAIVDTKELGEAVDMIKDLSEAIYYCSITEAMEKNDKNQQQDMYFTNTRPMLPPPEWERGEMYGNGGRMYYNGGNGGGSSSNSNGGSSNGNGGSYYGDGRYYLPGPTYPYESKPMMTADPREGRSGTMPRNYMEAKEAHKGKDIQMKELEKYMQELSGDITDMIKDASPEEKAMLQQKIATLASKIS